jgi:uncharacterized membrane protein YqhA
MLDKFMRLRYIFFVVIIFTGLDAIAFLLLGTFKSVQGYIDIFNVVVREEDKRPGLELLEGFDSFLISIVFLVFSLGLIRIFLTGQEDEARIPKWLDIKDLKGLKVLLWETILVALVVFSLNSVIRNITNITWEILILPAFILLLTISLHLMRGEKKNDKEE